MLKHPFPSRHAGAASDPCACVGCLGRGWGGCVAPMPGEPSFSAGTRNLAAVLAAPYPPCCLPVGFSGQATCSAKNK